jgi:AraC-like DNA-binding protein
VVLPIWKTANVFSDHQRFISPWNNYSSEQERGGKAMEQLLRQKGLKDLFSDAPAFVAARVSRKMRSAEPCEIIWWVYVASISISISSRFMGEVTGPLSYVIAIGGAAGCAWGWLLARTLFRAGKPIERWTLIVVGTIVAVEAYWELTSLSTGGGMAGEMRRIAANATPLVCFGAIAMVLVEALSGYSAQLPRPERRFRQIFALVYAAIVAIILIWAVNADEGSFAGQWANVVIGACVFICVVGSRMAVSFRKRHPLAALPTLAAPLRRKVLQTPSTAAYDKGLALRIRNTIDQAQQFTTPELKIADLATALGEQEYKVTQCITRDLGYRNFNHLINARRIEHAKQALNDLQNQSRSISSISFDCGFNSIGPFNRAFKQEVGMTPREFRAQAVDG